MSYTPKPGQDARTRDGRRVTGLALSLDRRHLCGFVGSDTRIWHANGRRWATDHTDELDLIGPWKDPAP